MPKRAVQDSRIEERKYFTPPDYEREWFFGEGLQIVILRFSAVKTWQKKKSAVFLAAQLILQNRPIFY